MRVTCNSLCYQLGVLLLSPHAYGQQVAEPDQWCHQLGLRKYVYVIIIFLIILKPTCLRLSAEQQHHFVCYVHQQHVSWRAMLATSLDDKSSINTDI